MESEPFELTLKGVDDAKKLGEDFAKELGQTAVASELLTCVVLSNFMLHQY